MVVTPPPSSTSLRTPPTPLYGAKIDSYQPYSPRRTTRAAAGQRFSGGKSSDHSRGISPPPSGQQSSKKRARREIVIMADSHGTDADVDMVDDVPELKGPITSGVTIASHGTRIDNTTMLPTPAKTPRKEVEVPAATLRSTARVLFPPRACNGNAEEFMPNARQRRSRGFLSLSLDGTDGSGGQIQIYTDSHERIPDVDPNEDNPFYVSKEKTEGQAQQSSQVAQGGDRKMNKELEKAIKRKDGMVYVLYVFGPLFLFQVHCLMLIDLLSRGRRFFQKFDDMDEEEAGGNGVAHSRRVTRSSIKPRILFPTEEQKRERELRDADPDADAQVDEEALTDIDEDALNEHLEHVIETDDEEEAVYQDQSYPATVRFASDGVTTRYLESGASTAADKAEGMESTTECAEGGAITPTNAHGRNAKATTPTASSNITVPSPSTPFLSTRTTRSVTRRRMAAEPTTTQQDRLLSTPLEGPQKKTSPFKEWQRVKTSEEKRGVKRSKEASSTTATAGNVTTAADATTGVTAVSGGESPVRKRTKTRSRRVQH